MTRTQDTIAFAVLLFLCYIAGLVGIGIVVEKVLNLAAWCH